MITKETKTILNSLNDLAFLKDQNLLYTFANQAFCDRFHLKIENIIGKSDVDLFNEQFDCNIRQLEQNTLNGETTRHISKQEIDGQSFLFETIRTPIFENDQAIGLTGISRLLDCSKDHTITNSTELDNHLVRKMDAIFAEAPDVESLSRNLCQVVVDEQEHQWMWALLFNDEKKAYVSVEHGFHPKLTSSEEQVVISKLTEENHINPKENFTSCEFNEAILIGKYPDSKIWIAPLKTLKKCVGLLIVATENLLACPRKQKKFEKLAQQISYLISSQLLQDDNRSLKNKQTASDKHFELRDAYVQLQEAICAGNIGLWSWNLKTNKVFYSQEWKQQLGYETREIGDNIDELRNRIHPEDIGSVNEQLNTVIEKTKKNHELIFRIKHKDGSYKWINAHASTFTDDSGQADRILGCHVDITSKKKIEHDLRTRENTYRTLVNTTPYGIQLTDLQGRIIYSNPSLNKILGYNELELTGSYFWDHIENSILETNAEQFYREIANRQPKPQKFICKSRRKDGRLIDIQVHWDYIYSSEGELENIISITSDITEQVKAEEELKKNQKLYKNLIDGLPDAIMRFNRKYECLFASNNINEVMPVEADEFIGKTHKNLGFPLEICTFWEEALENVFKLKQPHETEFESFGKKGLVSFNWRLIPELDDLNEVKSVLTIARNVTESKQLEKQLKKSEERFVLAMNATNDGLWDLDLINNRVYFSPGWKRMLGYEEDELESHVETFRSLIHPEELEETWDQLYKHINGKIDRFEVELRMQHKLGHWVNVLSRANAIRDENERAYRIIGTHVDISERKRVEEDLIEAKNKAVQANQAKDEFLAIMSHELRTPLNPIMGFASLMQYAITEEPYSKYIELILTSSRRMVKLIDNLLSYSRMQKEDVTPKETAFHLDDFLKDTIKSIQAHKKDNTVSLKNGKENYIQPYHSSLEIVADQDILHRILNNLLTNACKYTNNGSVTLYAGINRQDGDQLFLRFEIEDNGIGIPNEKLKTIFEPFVQVDSSFSRPYEGVGLGLAICKKLICYLNGDIGVCSKIGEGSRFWVEIPVKIIQKNKCSQIPLNIPEEIPLASGCSFLIAEDQIDNQSYIETCIKTINANATIVSNGSEAIEALKKNEYDMVLMDLSMPVMNGFEATKIIKSNPALKHIPIVALTAHDTIIARKQAQDAGVDAYVSKPIAMPELTKIIHDVLKSTENEKIT